MNESRLMRLGQILLNHKLEMKNKLTYASDNYSFQMNVGCLGAENTQGKQEQRSVVHFNVTTTVTDTTSCSGSLSLYSSVIWW